MELQNSYNLLLNFATLPPTTNQLDIDEDLRLIDDVALCDKEIEELHSENYRLQLVRSVPMHRNAQLITCLSQ